jgi:hypothetical protein
VVAGDFDGDGELDLAYVDNFHGTVEVLLGHGDGTFANPIGSPTSSIPQKISAADLNGDGKLDVVTVDLLGGVNVLLGKGDASFHPPVPLSSTRSNSVAEIGDLIHDGIFRGVGGCVSEQRQRDIREGREIQYAADAASAGLRRLQQ